MMETDRAKAWAAALVASTTLIAGFEGERLVTYLDPIGILTVCYGETSPKYAQPGASYTSSVCHTLLEQRLAKDYAPGLARCITAPTTSGQKAALLSFGYNVGVSATCSSTLVRKLNAGDCFGAAREFNRWTKASGRVLPGLVARRAQERSLFEEGCHADP